MHRVIHWNGGVLRVSSADQSRRQMNKSKALGRASRCTATPIKSGSGCRRLPARDPDYAVALFWRRDTMQHTQKQKMLAGQLYQANDPEIQADQQSAKAWVGRYNAALGATADERRELLRERLAAVGNGAVIRPPFHCDYGHNISLGGDVFLD